MTTVNRLEDYDTSQRYNARLVSSERITPAESEDEVRELVLEVNAGGFRPELGQSVAVLAPADPAFGKEHHLRLYSVADLPSPAANGDGRPRIKICVKRCSYVDDYSGEVYPGVASNYLCDLSPGATITVAGPYGLAFEVPPEMNANLILIGSGTGIAPFRALIKHIYRNVPEWRGKIRLFYGARSGLELLYMNEKNDDLAQYYDQETFEAIQALSPRPHWRDPIAWREALMGRADELLSMLDQPETYVYLAGLEKIRDELDHVFGHLVGGEDKWRQRKEALIEARRWVELLY